MIKTVISSQYIVRVAAAGLVAAAVFMLTACQPEPATDALKAQGGNVSEQVEGETSWGGDEGPEYTPNASLPATFPATVIVFPSSATLYDAGERSAGVWFAVVNVADDAAMDEAVQLLTSNGFAVISDERSGENRSVVLESSQYSVTLLNVTSSSGQRQLSYDVSQRTS